MIPKQLKSRFRLGFLPRHCNNSSELMENFQGIIAPPEVKGNAARP
jgi:hypothetical protein